MPVMDEFKEERETLKNAPFKKKLEYFWYYYKIHTLVAVFLIAAIGYFIYDKATAKKYVYSIGLMNATQIGSEETLSPAIEDLLQINTDKETVLADASFFLDFTKTNDTSYYSAQKLMAVMATGDIDLMVGASDIITNYAYQDYFTDLNAVFSADWLKAHSDILYYVDLDVYEQISELSSKNQDTSTVMRPDPTKPENMKNPVPVGFYVNSDILTTNYYFSVGLIGNADYCENIDGIVMAIPVKSLNVARTNEVVEYLLNN